MRRWPGNLAVDLSEAGRRAEDLAAAEKAARLTGAGRGQPQRLRSAGGGPGVRYSTGRCASPADPGPARPLHRGPADHRGLRRRLPGPGAPPGPGRTGVGRQRRRAGHCSRGRTPVQLLDIAKAFAGRGLDGDRYATGAGTFESPRRPSPGYDLTLIAAEVLDELAAAGHALDFAGARRNVLTRGIDVNALVGRTFRIGEVLCQGSRLRTVRAPGPSQWTRTAAATHPPRRPARRHPHRGRDPARRTHPPRIVVERFGMREPSGPARPGRGTGDLNPRNSAWRQPPRRHVSVDTGSQQYLPLTPPTTPGAAVHSSRRSFAS